jgi:hypothetical protein
LSSLWPPPSSVSSPPSFCSPPPSPQSKVQPLPAWISIVLVQAFNWSFGGRKKEGGKEELKVILWLSFYLFCNSFDHSFIYAIRYRCCPEFLLVDEQH